jgi:hypothetical protein
LMICSSVNLPIRIVHWRTGPNAKPGAFQRSRSPQSS